MKAFNVIWAVQCNSLSVLHYRFGIHWSKTFEKRVSSQSWTHLLKTFETNFPIPLSSQKKTRIYSWLHSSNELKLILTNVALERLPSFMNWCYVNILNGSFLQTVISHMLHWKRCSSYFHELLQCVDSSASFLQSLHHKWCFWKASFLQQLMLHVCSIPRLVQQFYLNDFLPPWTDAKWLFKLPFCVCKTIATIITLGILGLLLRVSISSITSIEF